jgi:hypothetical protein
VLAVIVVSASCLPAFIFDGVAARIGVAGKMGTAGKIVDDVLRDMGRDSTRDADSSLIARGTAWTENPGGMTGVARLGGSWLPLIELLVNMGIESGSLSFTSASTLNDACSSALKGTSSARCC